MLSYSYLVDVIFQDPVEVNWVPSETLTEFQKAALGFMRLLEEHGTPRQHQRDIVNYFNANFAPQFKKDGNYNWWLYYILFFFD